MLHFCAVILWSISKKLVATKTWSHLSLMINIQREKMQCHCALQVSQHYQAVFPQGRWRGGHLRHHNGGQFQIGPSLADQHTGGRRRPYPGHAPGQQIGPGEWARSADKGGWYACRGVLLCFFSHTQYILPYLHHMLCFHKSTSLYPTHYAQIFVLFGRKQTWCSTSAVLILELTCWRPWYIWPGKNWKTHECNVTKRATFSCDLCNTSPRAATHKKETFIKLWDS